MVTRQGRLLRLLILLLTLGASARGSAATEGALLLEQARASSPERYAYAVRNGARIELTSDGRSFYVHWEPEPGEALSGPPVIVTLHGHGSWAFDEFFLWHAHAKERGLAVLALQWWFGKGEKLDDYYLPGEVYRVVVPLLDGFGIAPGRALLHGFSRGAANTYGVAAYDVRQASRYFGLVIANAGKPGLDFPVNVDIDRGLFGERPFAGTHWVTVCGELDPNPDRDGCPGMDEAAEWLKHHGGAVDLQIRDATGDHGAFHRNPANVSAALDVFAFRLQPQGEREGQARSISIRK